MKISLSSIFLSNFSNLAGTQFCGEIKTSVSRQSHADGNGSDHYHSGGTDTCSYRNYDIRRKQSYYFYFLLTSDIEHLIDLSDHKFPIMCVVGDNVGRNVPMITIEWG